MTMFKVMLGYAGTGVVGTAAGIAARSVYWHMLGVSVIDEKTLMPIGVMVAVGTTLMFAGWRAGKTVTKFEDKIVELTDEVKEINRRIDNLPCLDDQHKCNNGRKK